MILYSVPVRFIFEFLGRLECWVVYHFTRVKKLWISGLEQSTDAFKFSEQFYFQKEVKVYSSNVTCEMGSEVQICNGLRLSTIAFIPETTKNPEFNLK